MEFNLLNSIQELNAQGIGGSSVDLRVELSAISQRRFR